MRIRDLPDLTELTLPRKPKKIKESGWAKPGPDFVRTLENGTHDPGKGLTCTSTTQRAVITWKINR